MVWFSEQVLTSKMIMSNMLARVRNEQLTPVHLAPSLVSRWKNVQEKAIDILEPYFGLDEKERGDTREDSFVHRALAYCKNQPHIMEFTRIRAINALISLIKAAIAKVMEYNDNHAEIPLSDTVLKSYFSRYLVFAVLWSFGGSLSLKDRLIFCQELAALAQVPLPDNKKLPLIDYEVKVDTGDWEQWEDRVNRAPPQDLESQAIVRPDVVINTVDTHRHNDVITGWLSDHQPLILCGPPGSGKSMTLAMVLKALPQYDMVTLNFSSTTTPDLVMKALLSNCKQDKGPNGIVLRPSNPHKWLVIFCDEINLPMEDAYKTQHVITFLRQISEQGGFWRASDLQFITLGNTISSRYRTATLP
jgi:dynein heavy chain 1